jgi:hypothetical protein
MAGVSSFALGVLGGLGLGLVVGVNAGLVLSALVVRLF